MRGRPKKTDDERCDVVLRIRLTTEERQAIENAAVDAALDSSAWARMVLLAEAKRVPPKGKKIP